MSDNSVEKSFLYLLACSVVIHVVIFVLIMLIPEEKKPVGQEPYMVELRDLPEPPPLPPARQKEVRRLDERKRRVEREIAPKGERERDRLAAVPRTVPVPPQRPVPQESREARPAERGDYPVRRDAPVKRESPQREASGGKDLFRKKKEQVPDLSNLMPSADKMAKLEESYRKKYGPEVEEGETKFLNTEDIQFGSFLRRFENAVYGVWRYPPEAVHMGIEGTTPVRITFNRAGQIVNLQVLETSGSRILDAEVVRTLRQIGPIGTFPKGYEKETFNLIAFFQYGLSGGSRRLH